MCNNCIHKPVCSKFAATGGHVRECEHFKEERKGKWDTVFYERNGTLASYSHICPKCKYFYRDLKFKGHNYCPECGCDMRGAEDG